MRIFIFTLVLSIVFFTLTAQNVTLTSKSGKYRLGLNIGNFYQQSDVEKLPGFGYGLTLERRLKPNNTDFFSFSLRGRYLHGYSKGLDYSNFNGIQNNQAVNGVRNNNINYFNPPDSIFFYNNFRTEMNDFSVELMLYFNQLWQKTNILLYGWGGLSMADFEAKIDQVDANGQMYDYSSIDPGNKSYVYSQLQNMLDGKYESWADNLTKTGITYGPSAGIGLGYQITKRISLGVEHKITWSNSDLLDGQQWDKNNIKTLDDDIYHYTVLGIKFLLGGGADDEPEKKKPDIIKTEDSRKPNIYITTPTTNPYNSADCRVYISGSVTNLTSVEQLVIKENNVILKNTDYFFRPETGSFKIERNVEGNVEYQLIATNAYGIANKTQQILCVNVNKKPEITIEEPKQNPFQNLDCVAFIVAFIPNVKGKEFITVTENGSPLLSSKYTYNSNNRLIISKTIKDYSVFAITARNDFGISSANVIIDCRKPSEKPSIKITQPSVSPYNSPDCRAEIIAYSTGIKDKNQISVTENGITLSPSLYSFELTSGQIKLNKVIGSNTTNYYIIKVQNDAGSASDNITIQCKDLKKPPIISISEPYDNPHKTYDCRAYIVAVIQNIDNINQITVKEDGYIVSSSYYTFDNTKTLRINKSLSSDASITIEATNEAGKDQETVEIQCVKTTPVLPVINIIEPSISPTTVKDCKITIKAIIENIQGIQDISVVENGNSIGGYWSYNSQTKLLTISKEITGNSVFEIVAVNSFGNARKSTTIKCDKTSNLPTVSIVYPPNNPFITNNCNVSFRAITTNVTTKTQIMIKDNGSLIPSSGYSFDPSSGVINFSRTIQTKSQIEIKVSTATGTASASSAVECQVTKLAPEIQILSPSSSPFTISDCNAKVIATIKNIENNSQITVRENGVFLPQNYWFYEPSNQTITISKTILKESNFEISASTSAGSASKSVLMKCNQLSKLPTINIVYPGQNPFISSTCQVNIRAVTTNVNDKTQIVIKDNGKVLNNSEFNFEPSSGIINLGREINEKSIIDFKVTTQNGSAVASVVIECPKKVLPPTVVITEPAINPFVTSECLIVLKATIKNIENKSQIVVKENGNILQSSLWTFDAMSGLLSLRKAFSGDATVDVTVTNSSGTANAKTTFNCKPLIESPSISILNPTTNPYLSYDCKAEIKAKLKNIILKTQIVVRENGLVLNQNEYQFDMGTQIMSISKQLNGNADYTITVTNEGGTATAKISIQCIKAILPPQVKIIQPTSSPYASPACNIIIKAQTTNIQNKTQITIKEGTSLLGQNDYLFDAATGIITITRTIKGITIYEIKVTNNDGTASATQNISCLSPALPPIITITQPSISPFNTSNCIADIKATIKNIKNKSGIKVYIGTQLLALNEFSFDTNSGQFSLNKAMTGSSTIKITASNRAGSDTKELTINCIQKPNPPEVIIITPSTDPYTIWPCNAYIVAKTKGITQKSQIKIYKNGELMSEQYFNFNQEEGEIMFDQGLNQETTFKIVVQNNDGSAEDKVTIKCGAP